MTQPAERRILIADDEPLARERLLRLLDSVPGHSVCAEAADGREVLEAVAQHQPDVVLLDIRMPGTDGMEVARQLNRLAHPPAIIFCTAYDEYAINAFSVQAMAYLLKPVRREALEQALGSADRINRVQLQALQETSVGQSPTLPVKTHRGTELVDITQVYCCEADQKYVTLHQPHAQTITDHSLRELESRFPAHLLRIHRNTLIGVRYLKALLRDNDGHYKVSLAGSERQWPVSRRHASSVRQWLEQPG